MTTLSATSTAGTVGTDSRPQRITKVVSLHLVNRTIYIGVPWIIIGTAWAVSMVIAALIWASAGENRTEALEGMRYSWAVLSPLWYFAVVAIQAISSTFPFALGYSLTRREFYLGTALMFTLISAVNAVALTALTEIEKITGGWWIGAHMFTALWFGNEPMLVNLLSYFSFQMVVFFVGAAIATIYMRWRTMGMLVFWVSLVVLVLGVAAGIVLGNVGTQLVGWFAAQGIAGIFGWLLIPAAVAGLLGYFVLRKATPKN